jgi:hypothetical protein
MVNGSSPDISSYGQFDWYEPVYFWDPVKGFPYEKKRIGRWIGVAENYTDIMAFYILTESGKVIVRKSVRALSQDERKSPAVLEEMTRVDVGIRSKIGDPVKDKDVDENLIGDFPLPPNDLFV